MRRSQIEKIEKYFPPVSGQKSQGIQRAVDLFTDAIDRAGDDFILDQIFARGGYRIEKIKK